MDCHSINFRQKETTVALIKFLHPDTLHTGRRYDLFTTYMRLLLYFKLVKDSLNLHIQAVNNGLCRTIFQYSPTTTVFTNQKTFQKRDQLIGSVFFIFA